MSVKKIFISFDYDRDKELRGSFLAEARRYSKHQIVDCSLPYALGGRWTREALSRIRGVDVVIFLCGKDTHSALGVEAEMTITQQLDIPYILLKGRRNSKCSKPRGANRNDKIQPRKWKRINALLDGCVRSR